jgi:hypothetical protein
MVMGALVAGLSGPAFAQGTTPAAPAKPATPAAPAKPATPAAPAATAVDAATKSARGTVKSVAAGSLVVSTGRDQMNLKDMTFTVGPDTKYTKDGKPALLKDLIPNDRVAVEYTEAGGKMTAKSVTVRGRPAKGIEAKPKS